MSRMRKCASHVCSAYTYKGQRLTWLIPMRGRHIRMHHTTHSHASYWHIHACDMTHTRKRVPTILYTLYNSPRGTSMAIRLSVRRYHAYECVMSHMNVSCHAQLCSQNTPRLNRGLQSSSSLCDTSEMMHVKQIKHATCMNKWRRTCEWVMTRTHLGLSSSSSCSNMWETLSSENDPIPCVTWLIHIHTTHSYVYTSFKYVTTLIYLCHATPRLICTIQCPVSRDFFLWRMTPWDVIFTGLHLCTKQNLRNFFVAKVFFWTQNFKFQNFMQTEWSEEKFWKVVWVTKRGYASKASFRWKILC